MFNSPYLKLISFTLLLSLLTSCSLTSGYYGPFTLVIEPENGKKVEDIIVTLMFGGSGGHGKYSSYNEVKVASTGEKITFPRGYVTGTEGEVFGMYLSIEHPYYSEGVTSGINRGYVNIKTKQKDEEIDLGERNIKFNEISEQDITRYFKKGRTTRIKGRSITEPITRDEAIIKLKRTRLHMEIGSYFLTALRADRDDLIDKYLALKLTDIYGEAVDTTEAKAFEQDLRASIDYYRNY
jgi:hypothetical protein